VPIHVRMTSRDPGEAHRAATPLELFFDLTFVVAVAQAGAALHHNLLDGHLSGALLGYPLVFFAIWWAWMNFTWFASAYDTDDTWYRLAVLVQMTGVLILAAGVPRAVDHRDFGVVTAGYVVMRLALVALWLRAAAADPARRTCALRYAVGISILQVGWIARLALPDGAGLAAFFVLAALELCVPVWAERAGRTPWHPGHIAERYGLFTIIVLGESIAAATVGVQTALDADTSLGDLATVVAGGLLIVFSMWWFYFDLPAREIVERAREQFAERLGAAITWGYGHYFVFASVAATGAGLVIAVDRARRHAGLDELSDLGAAFAVTVPVATYLVTVWALHAPYKPPSAMRNYSVPVCVLLLLGASFTPEPVLLSGLLLAGLVAATVVSQERDLSRSRAGGTAR
jgi:low temperature requirement protein LtrA